MGGGLGQFLLREAGRPVLRREEIRRSRGKELDLVIAEQSLHSLVPAPVPALVVHDEDGVVLDLVRGSAVALLRATLCLFSLLSRRDLAPELLL